MVGSIRERLNEAPPWVGYALAGGAAAIAIGIVLWQLSPSSGGGGTGGEKHIYFTDTQDGITVSAEEAREMLREAAKANPGQRPMIKNPKSGKYTGVIGEKCEKCGAYFELPEKSGSIFPDSWRDECPKCGHSAQKERAIQAALKQKKEGKYDPEKIPPFIRRAVEEYEREQGGGGGG